ncbi:MAG: sugar kinase [Candidatus Nephrothrix sp. EaCA]|nr:MAG: sugar kinase [Candidatus Nephrothrix sp. EaCA]
MLLGFDIGGTKCAVILGKKEADGKINMLKKVSFPTDKPVYEMLELLYGQAEKMLSEGGFQNNQLQGIGISCGGPLNSKRGIILSPPNLPGWDAVPIAELTAKRFGVKTRLQNDANACAVAEWKFGAGRGFNNVVFLTFGTGMGAGLILNGQLYSGTNDLAGEVGHVRLEKWGPVGFGKEGSFEGFCSGGGIAQLAQSKVRSKLQTGEKVSFCSSMENLPNLSAKRVAEAAFEGDATAIDIYRTCGYQLGAALSLLIDILNPEVIILGSIYGHAKELLEPYMREVIRKEALQDSASLCSIVPAQLSEHIGDMAALCTADYECKVLY